MSDEMKFNEYQEYREYEERLEKLKSREYTDDELDDWRIWAEKWADPNV